MGEFVRLEVSEGVGVLRLDRPPLNALSRQVVGELAEATRQAAASEEVGAVVLWGGEKVFSAGADLKEFSLASPAATFAYGRELQEAFSTLAELPKVMIAAITGYALGGGCELALTADFRYAAAGARLGQPEIQLGLIPGAGGTQRLPRLIGPARAKDLIYTGRTLRGEEALGIGLVDRVFPSEEVLDQAVAAARTFARGPLVALRAAKLAIDRGLETDIDSGLAVERGAFSTLFSTEDWRNGVQSFFELGPGKAQFSGR